MSSLTDTPLYMVRGDTKTLNFTITAGGSPVDLTGITLRFTMKTDKDDGDADAVLQKNVQIIDAEAGTAMLLLTPQETDLTLRGYWYDVEMTNGTTVTTILRGTIEVSYDITRGDDG